MSEFDINLRKVKEILEGSGSITNELGNISDAIGSIGSSLGFRMSAGEDIKRRLRKASGDVRSEKDKISGYHRALRSISSLYEKTENGICGAAADGKITFIENVERIAGNVFEYGGGIFRNIGIGYVQTLADFLISTEVDILHGEGKANLTSPKLKNKLYNSKDNFKTPLSDKKTVMTQKSTADGKTWNKEDVTNSSEEERKKKKYNAAPLKETAKFVGVSGSLSGSLLDINSQVSEGYGTAKNHITVGKAEVHGNAYAGLYTVGEDGNKKFTPGFGAEVGASVTAFSDDAEAVFGSKYNNVYAKGNVTVGKAEAKAGVDVGLYDEHGKLNPSANIDASAELIAAGASASVGGTIAGTRVEGNAGVTVGVGAHAKAGIKDGVVSLDIGAAVGVGVSVNLEIDMSGTFEFIGENIGKIGNAVSSFAKSIGWWT